MKIKSQVYLLLTGILLIPVLFFVFIAFMRYFDSPERIFIPTYEEVAVDDKSGGISSEEWGKVRRFLERLPKNIEWAVIDRKNNENNVVFSIIPNLVPGTFISNEGIIKLFLVTRELYAYQIDFPLQDSENSLMVVTRFSKDHKKTPKFFKDLFFGGGIVLIIMFAFCAVMVFLIVKSLTKSVTALEEATRRITQGEFGLKIDIKGSNEITSLSSSLEKMRTALMEEQLRKSRFIMGISHDLRTPLALIKGYTEAISDGMVEDPKLMNSSLEIIRQKSQQLDDMIEDLISFVKLDTEEWRKNIKPLNGAKIFNDYFNRLYSDGLLLGRRITGKITLPDDLVILCDEKVLLRVLENLTGNALRYTKEGGFVDFSVSLYEGEVCVSIADNGVGISQEEMPFIFDLFYRGSNSRREEGSGLGLAVVKSILDSLGWKIEVFSQKGEGSCFIVRIPPGENIKEPVSGS